MGEGIIRIEATIEELQNMCEYQKRIRDVLINYVPTNSSILGINAAVNSASTVVGSLVYGPIGGILGSLTTLIGYTIGSERDALATELQRGINGLDYAIDFMKTYNFDRLDMDYSYLEYRIYSPTEGQYYTYWFIPANVSVFRAHSKTANGWRVYKPEMEINGYKKN